MFNLGYTTANPKFEGEHQQPSEKNLNFNIESAYTYLINELNQNPSKIILFGRSLGSGPSLHLASKYKLGFILQLSLF